MENEIKKIYFPGLNGVRAIAAMIVLIWHIDQFSPLFGIEKIGFAQNGMSEYGVVMFFVLSGFLITYLLRVEKKEFNKINFRKFYWRRILRIWPIYYLVIVITILLLSVGLSTLKYIESTLPALFFLYGFLLANLAFVHNFTINTITPLWSVAAEEQFYAFWPLIIAKTKNIQRALTFVIVFYLLLKLVFRVFENGPIYHLIFITGFDCMALGGLGACWVYENKWYLKIIYNKVVQIIAWGVLFISIFYKPPHLFTFIDHEISAIFYLIIIMNVATNEKSLLKLENSLFDFLGKISYGIYIYHMTIIVVLSAFAKAIGFNFRNTSGYFLLYFVIILSTIAVAYLSYRYFESYFLKIKSRFTLVPSASSK